MSKTSPTWCPFLFHSIMITPYSQVRPCCRFDPTVYESGFSWRNKETLDDFYNKEIFNSLREQAASGQKVRGCHRCYREEALGIPSMRQKSFPAAIPQEDNSDHSSLKIAVLELGVGRVCNLKCRSCDSYFSTKWDSDAKTLNFSMPEPGVNIDLDLISDELLKNVTVLKITGGEPCLSPAFHKFLNRLTNSNIANQIELEIFTNATIAPPQPLVSTLPHFKKVHIRLSIDAVGAKNTYIRHPSDWEKINQICEQWFQIQASFSQLSVGFANTISIFNILDIFEFIAWTRTFNQKPHPNIIFQTVHDPLYLSVACLPQKIRQNIYSQFTKQWQEHKQITENTPLEGKLTQIAKLLTDSTEDTNYLTDFYRITSQIDQLRDESFSKTFPDLESILNFSDYKA